jgi:hypothetical protein
MVAGTRQALPAEPLGERLRVLQLGKAEYHKVTVVVADSIRPWRRS